MSSRNYSNTAVVTTIGALTNSATSGTLAANTGWPAAPCTAVIEPGTGNAEVVLITARSGNTISAMTRGYDGTTAVAHAANSVIAHEVAGIDFSESNAHIQASAAVHGLTGTVVGTTDTQTLTNKTISGSANTLTNPSCGLYLQAAATTGTGWNKTAFGSGTEEWDNASMHDTTTNNSRITVPVAGLYLVVWRYIIEATMQTGAQIRFNGAAAPTNSNGRYGAQSAAGSTWVTPSAGADVFILTANDYVEMYTTNTTSSTANAHFRLAVTMLSS